MQKYIIIAVVIIGMWLLYNFYMKHRTNSITNKLMKCLETGDSENFEKLVNAKSTKRFIHPFNLYFLKLNAAIMKGNKTEIKLAFKDFDNLRINNAQKKMVYEKGFYYYLSQQNKRETKKYYDLLIDLGSSDNEVLSCFYDTYLMQGAKHLDKMIKRLEQTPDEEKPAYEALIADMYKNLNDKKNSDKYEALAAKHFEESNKKVSS